MVYLARKRAGGATTAASAHLSERRFLDQAGNRPRLPDHLERHVGGRCPCGVVVGEARARIRLRSRDMRHAPAVTLHNQIGDRVLRSADGTDADRDARPLRLGVVRRGRRPLLADSVPDFVRDHLVRSVERELEVLVLADARVPEHARRILAALLAALHRVVIALAIDGKNALAPGWRSRGAHLSLDLRDRVRRDQRGDNCEDGDAAQSSRRADLHRAAVCCIAATHAKFAASFVLPVPFQRATWPYGHRGRVRSTTPSVSCAAMICFGALPALIHSSIAATWSNSLGPGPPRQWFMPGTMYS